MEQKEYCVSNVQAIERSNPRRYMEQKLTQDKIATLTAGSNPRRYMEQKPI